jgi:hypothetical protein
MMSGISSGKSRFASSTLRTPRDPVPSRTVGDLSLRQNAQQTPSLLALLEGVHLGMHDAGDQGPQREASTARVANPWRIGYGPAIKGPRFAPDEPSFDQHLGFESRDGEMWSVSCYPSSQLPAELLGGSATHLG